MLILLRRKIDLLSLVNSMFDILVFHLSMYLILEIIIKAIRSDATDYCTGFASYTKVVSVSQYSTYQATKFKIWYRCQYDTIAFISTSILHFFEYPRFLIIILRVYHFSI